ncbi:MAG: TIGR04086 family membrane protein [Firmicutes bacterium HGW-Firmicutes-14]|nr:MAG: TIGR04086 family membrane protein [Firmicutes bacterium HGW-Firmicutes-14]
MGLKFSSTLKPQGNIHWTAILYGTLLAVIVSIILMAIGGTVMYYKVFNERLIPVIGLTILFLSIFIGGLISARKAGRSGWFHGLAVGLVFLFLTILFNVAVPGGIFGFPVFKKIVASVVAGCLGGIWGVGK